MAGVDYTLALKYLVDSCIEKLVLYTGLTKDICVEAFNKAGNNYDKAYDQLLKNIREKLEDLLKKKGLFEQLSLISWGKLNAQILEGNMDADVVKLTRKEKDWRISLSKKKDEAD